MEDMDNNTKSNPKAFWFGNKETEAEILQLLEQKINEVKINMKDETDVTVECIDSLYKVMKRYRSILRVRFGNDIVAKMKPMEVQLKPGSVPLKIGMYSM